MIPLEIERYIEDRTGWLIEKTVEFIRKPSISGSEGEAAGLLAGTLEDSGLPASIDAAGNVVAVLEGPGTAHPQGKTLVLNVHLDTVPAGNPSSWRHDPFSGAIEDGRIYGRGACDTKGAWAPMVLAMEAIRQSGAKLQGQVIFSAVVMEELTCSVGMRTLLDRTLIDNRPDYIILGEPTGLNIAIGHKGRTELAVSTGGRSCHASTPWEGDNAIYKAGRAITSIERLAGEINSGPGDEVFGKTSLAMTDIVCNPGVRNVIPDSCTMYLDYRFPPGETPEYGSRSHTQRPEKRRGGR
ncbi:MAG: Succinyl-diaminopimelate desuccinylase [Syntrophorhabdaceae bacterium PtaU1.Bin034]|nr:MAG: Succinyl-diaminopimelate desuccinylase [Syntrophorhabdaceae bacterium PtaU1.Bin034]